MTKKVFLISGKAQHGKDSVANMLVQSLPNSITLHFADVLKFYAKKYFNWSGGKTEKERDLLQKLGTDRIRSRMGQNYWAERACDIIEILEEDYDYFFVADCRFLNEITYPKERLKNFDIITVKVIRTNFDNGLTEEQKNHRSEIALDDFVFDYVVKSDSGLDKLEKAVLAFLKDFRERANK